MKAISGALLLACFIAATQGIGLKILGGYVEVRTKDSSGFLGYQHQWGSTSTWGAVKLSIGESYCRYETGSTEGYCKHYIFISTKNNPTETYYQILGSYQMVYYSYGFPIPDPQSPVRHQYGQQTPAGTGQAEFTVFSGESWAPGYSRWGYAYLYFVVQQVNSQSITNAFSFRQHKGGAEDNMLQEYFVPFNVGWPYAYRKTISQFRCYTSQWKEHTNCYQHIWRDN